MENNYFTRLPNHMINKIPEMTGGETKIFVVVARKTYGYQKSCDQISLSQFQELTGLSRQGVINGINAAVKHGWLVCENNGNINTYWINELSDFWGTSQNSLPVEESASQKSRPVLVKKVDHLDQKLVKNFDTQKKDIKENIKEISMGDEKPLTERQEYIRGITKLYNANFVNNQQFDLVYEWLDQYGKDRIMQVFEYYRLKGKGLGAALATMKTSLKTWNWNDVVTAPEQKGNARSGYNV